MGKPHTKVSGGGRAITVCDIVIDEAALKEEARSVMAKVVLVHDLADHYEKDRSAFLKMLKRNDIELLFIADRISGQQRRCVTVETAKEIEELLTPKHELVSIDAVFENTIGEDNGKDN